VGPPEAFPGGAAGVGPPEAFPGGAAGVGPPEAFPGGAAGVGRAEAPVVCETVAAVAVRDPGAGPGVAGGGAGPLGRTRTCGGGTPVVVATARPPGLA
jgi:hypothetical protein